MAALTEFAGVLVHEFASNKTLLPVCVAWCPIDQQPTANCLDPNASTASTRHAAAACVSQLGHGYFVSVMAAGFDLAAAVVGLMVVGGFCGCRACDCVRTSKRVADSTGSDDERRRLIEGSSGEVN